MVRIDIWSLILLVCVLIGCSSSRSSELLIEEETSLSASNRDAEPSDGVKPPPSDAATVPPASIAQDGDDYRTTVPPTSIAQDGNDYRTTVPSQTDFTGLRQDVTIQARPQNNQSNTVNGPIDDGSGAMTAPPETELAQDTGRSNDQLSSSASVIADPWHHLLQAPETQGEPILPTELLDLQEQRAALDALVLPEGDPRAAVVGYWQQIDGERSSDFGNGGYNQSFVIFRTDGLLDLVRIYGTDGTIRITKRFDYVIASEGTISLGLSEEYRPRFPSRAQRIPCNSGEVIVITPPTLSLPCKLKYTASEEGLELDGKMYERVSLPPLPNENSSH